VLDFYRLLDAELARTLQVCLPNVTCWWFLTTAPSPCWEGSASTIG